MAQNKEGNKDIKRQSLEVIIAWDMICGWPLEVSWRRQPLCLVSTQRQGPEVAVPRQVVGRHAPVLPVSFGRTCTSSQSPIACRCSPHSRMWRLPQMPRVEFRIDSASGVSLSPRPTCIWACRWPLTKQAGPSWKQRGPGDLRCGSLLGANKTRPPPPPPSTTLGRLFTPISRNSDKTLENDFKPQNTPKAFTPKPPRKRCFVRSPAGKVRRPMSRRMCTCHSSSCPRMLSSDFWGSRV